MAGAATVTAPALARALDLITRVRGVRGAMVVSRSDGLVVAEQLMEGIKGSAVAALASSLAGRLQRAMVSAGLGPSQFWHLQCDHGALLVVPAGPEAGLLLVAVTEADVNVGLVRLELLRAAETAA